MLGLGSITLTRRRGAGTGEGRTISDVPRRDQVDDDLGPILSHQDERVVQLGLGRLPKTPKPHELFVKIKLILILFIFCALRHLRRDRLPSLCSLPQMR